MGSFICYTAVIEVVQLKVAVDATQGCSWHNVSDKTKFRLFLPRRDRPHPKSYLLQIIQFDTRSHNRDFHIRLQILSQASHVWSDTELSYLDIKLYFKHMLTSSHTGITG